MKKHTKIATTENINSMHPGTGNRITTCTRLWCVILVVVIAGITNVSSVHAQSPRGKPGGPPLLFLGNETLPPMIYTRNGEAVGLVIDLMKAIADRMESQVEIRAMNWSEAQQLVQDGQADALLQINETPFRRAYLDFSEPLLVSEFSIFRSNERQELSSVEDLGGLRVGVEGRGLPIQLLAEYPEVRIEVIPDLVAGFDQLAAGNIDALIADRWVGSYILAEHHIRGVRIAEIPVSRSQSAIAVRKGNTELLGEINRALAGIKQDGTYAAILDDWRSKEVVIRTLEQWSEMRRLTLSSVIIALVVALMAVAGQFVTIRQQRRTAQRLRESELAIKKSESRLHTVMETIPEGVVVADAETKRLVFANASFARMLGYDRNEVLQLSVSDVHPPHELPGVADSFTRELSGESVPAREIQVVRKDKSIFLANIENGILEMDGRPCFLGVFSDITERKQYEERIASLLRDKELLLKETHHRIKNNMNTVHSLLSLQAQASKDRDSQTILLNAAGRVRGMRLLYDKLYLSDNFHDLGTRTFFTPLIEEILAVFSSDPPVACTLDLDDFTLTAKVLSPLAIILNELVTNSLKYAFVGRTDPSISLTARKTGSTVTLVFEDNGIGLPETENLQTATGFGMQLIDMLVQQMDGTIHIDRQGGTKYTITMTA